MLDRRVACSLSVALASLTGCSEVVEDSGVAFRIDARGALALIEASTSADHADIELEWQATLTNERGFACPVALYEGVMLELPSEDVDLPQRTESALAASPWPSSWEGGELVAEAVVEPGATFRFDADTLGFEDGGGAVWIAVATCPDARLQLELDADATFDLGTGGFVHATSLVVVADHH